MTPDQIILTIIGAVCALGAFALIAAAVHDHLATVRRGPTALRIAKRRAKRYGCRRIQ